MPEKSRTPSSTASSTFPNKMQQLYDTPGFQELSPRQQQGAMSEVDPDVGLFSPEQFLGFRDTIFGGVGGKSIITRAPTTLEKARLAVGHVPENVLGTAGGILGGMAGLALTRHPAGAYAGAVTGAGIGGGAGRAYSNLIESLGEEFGLVKGGMLAGPPGAAIYEAARLTAPSNLYAPSRVRKQGLPFWERVKKGAGEQAVAELGGRTLGALGGVIGKGLKGARLPELDIAGQAAREMDVTMLPSTVAGASSVDRMLEWVAGLTTGGKGILAKAVKESGERVSNKLTTLLERVGPKLQPDVAGRLYQDAIRAEEKALTDAGGVLYDRVRKLTGMFSKRATKLERRVTTEPIEGIVGAKGEALTKRVVSQVPIERVENAVDIRPLKELFRKEVIEKRKGIHATSLSGEESGKLIQFAENMQQNADDLPYDEAALFLTDMLVALRSTSTPAFLKKLHGEAVGLLKADLARVARIGGPEAIGLHNQAKALWAAKEELYGGKMVISLAKKNPEFVAGLIWKPGNVTAAREAMKAAGGYSSKPWKAMRRQGFENRYRTAVEGANPEGDIAKWWGLMGPEMRQLIAGPNAKGISKVMEVMKAGEFTKTAKQLIKGASQAQFGERTAMARLPGLMSAGGGFALGAATDSPTLGLAGGALLFLSPQLAARMLLSKRGIALTIEGFTKKYRPTEVSSFLMRAAMVDQNLNQEIGRIEPLPPKNPLEGISLEELPTPLLGGR